MALSFRCTQTCQHQNLTRRQSKSIGLRPGKGFRPQWTNGPKELFYIEGSVDGNNDVIAVPVDAKTGFKTGTPKVFFKGLYHPAGSLQNYSVTPDGQRILMMKPAPGAEASTRLVLVLNWVQSLRRLGEAGK
jgi:hypothetical protein